MPGARGTLNHHHDDDDDEYYNMRTGGAGAGTLTSHLPPSEQHTLPLHMSTGGTAGGDSLPPYSTTPPHRYT